MYVAGGRASVCSSAVILRLHLQPQELNRQLQPDRRTKADCVYLVMHRIGIIPATRSYSKQFLLSVVFDASQMLLARVTFSICNRCCAALYSALIPFLTYSMGNKSSTPANEAEPPAPSLWQQAKLGYEAAVCAVIRPPRAEYSVHDLGPEHFNFFGRRIGRQDLSIRGAQGHRLEASHWIHTNADGTPVCTPCIVYLHGNSSCRAGALECLQAALELGASCFAADLSGSGQSEGQYVTLGHQEQWDLDAIVRFLRGLPHVSTIALWGRSMGAATALLHAHRDPSIAAMILDSPFADLRQLVDEIVASGQEQSGTNVPAFLVATGVRFVASSIKSRAGLDINTLKPIQNVDTCFVPALFIAGEHDHFVPPHHARQIAAKYAGEHELLVVEGGHNDRRPAHTMTAIHSFLQQAMQIPASALPGAGGSCVTQGSHAGIDPDVLAAAIAAGIDPSMLEGVPPAMSHYHATPSTLESAWLSSGWSPYSRRDVGAAEESMMAQTAATARVIAGGRGSSRPAAAVAAVGSARASAAAPAGSRPPGEEPPAPSVGVGKPSITHGGVAASSVPSLLETLPAEPLAAGPPSTPTRPDLAESAASSPARPPPSPFR